MTGIGFSLQPQYGVSLEQMMELLAQAGFSAVSPVWTTEENLDKIAALAAAKGMTLQSVHAPLSGIPQLWEPDTVASQQAQEEILRCVAACGKHHVPVMVLHSWQGIEYTFPAEPLDFRFFDRLADVARQKGVAVALENLEGEEYLAALLERYGDQPHIGFCWDSGHDHCYPHQTDFLEAYGQRLIMTHLNDNWGLRDPQGRPSGNDDLHFLPYDGKIHWQQWMERLAKAKKQDILNFELKIRSHSQNPADQPYAKLPLEEFIHLAGQRAGQIAGLYEKILSCDP